MAALNSARRSPGGHSSACASFRIVVRLGTFKPRSMSEMKFVVIADDPRRELFARRSCESPRSSRSRFSVSPQLPFRRDLGWHGHHSTLLVLRLASNRDQTTLRRVCDVTRARVVYTPGTVVSRSSECDSHFGLAGTACGTRGCGVQECTAGDARCQRPRDARRTPGNAQCTPGTAVHAGGRAVHVGRRAVHVGKGAVYAG